MMSSKTLALFALCALSSCYVTAGYDIRCIYPPGLPEDPFQARTQMTTTYGGYTEDNQVETPIVIRVAHWHTVCQTMCLAYHSPDILDPITKQPTLFKVPPFGQNAWSINMCSAQCYPHVYEGSGDLMERGIVDFKEQWDLDIEKPSDRLDIKNALDEILINGNPAPGAQILSDEDFHPYTMGHMLGFYIRGYMDEDGWNSQGDMQYDEELEMEATCTGSCRSYQDTSGYFPVPDPRKYSYLSNDATKYECTGLCRKWQPLQEGDSFGNLKLQEFITPQIGTKAHAWLRDPTITLEDPEYDLYEESLLVIERMKNMTDDYYKRDAVEFFDNKRLVRRIVQNGIKYYKAPGVYSFQEHLLYLMGLSTAEYDGVIQGWHEKRHHDLVRPTTVIKHWGNDELFTYGGDMSIGEPVTIKARDFEAFIRVMPHPEFPSGSSCLCTAYQEFTDEYTNYMFNETLTNQWSWRHNGRAYEFEYLTEMVDVCGESRLWGGMHFTAAIEGGEQICQGLGALAVDYVIEITNGSTFSDYAFYEGDELGNCPI